MTPLQSSSGFSVGQPVRILVSTAGASSAGAAIQLNPGEIGVITAITDRAAQGISFLVAVEDAVLEPFDTRSEPIDKSLEALPLDGSAIQSVETYVSAAETHGGFEDPDHEVGDLQQLLTAAFSMLTTDQRAAFFLKTDVRAVLVGAGVLED